MAVKQPIRLLTLLEADSLTGPAKAFIDFCREAGPAPSSTPGVEACVVTFRRRGRLRRNEECMRVLECAFDAVQVRHEPILERFRFDTTVILKLREAALHARPGIIESHSVKSHAIVWASGLWRRFPWVAYHHGYTTTDAKVRAYNAADRLTLRTADCVVTVAGAFVPLLVRRGVHAERLRVLHNALAPVTPAKLWSKAAARAALGLPENTQVVLSLGRLSREKGVADIVRAVALAAGSGREALLMIAGDGPERPAVERIASRTGIGARIRFAGRVLDPWPFYAAADVFALPSHSEGSPYTLLEALAAGVPVAATTAGGIPEIVSHGVTALLVPPRDCPSMAAAIEYILNDKRLAALLAENGRMHVAERFSPRIRARRLLHILNEVRERRRIRLED